MAFRWRADGDPTLNTGLVALWFYRGSGIAKKPYNFVIFQGGGVRIPCPPPSVSAHERELYLQSLTFSFMNIHAKLNPLWTII